MSRSRLPTIGICLTLAVAGFRPAAAGPPIDEDAVFDRFADHCFECHGYGESEGGFSFERLAAGDYGDDTLTKWEAVWKNVRSETMPPSHADRPEWDDRQDWLSFIEDSVFRLSEDAIDPGRVVLRRLNRQEYQRTVRDLTGVWIEAGEMLLPDNTGFGFDTVGEALTLSPVTLERYLAAAEHIVGEVVPEEGPSPPVVPMEGWRWRADTPGGKTFDRTPTIDRPFRMWMPVDVSEDGDYRFDLHWTLDEGWIRTTQKANLVVRLLWGVDEKSNDDQISDAIQNGIDLRKLTVEYADNGPVEHAIDLELKKGRVWLMCDVTPAGGDGKDIDGDQPEAVYGFYLRDTQLVGPLGGDNEYSGAAKKVFVGGPPPRDADGRWNEPESDQRRRLESVLRPFADRAFRRPIDDETLGHLIDTALATAASPQGSYESGVGQAMKLILVSPRFLYRVERSDPDRPSRTPLGRPVDDYTLASRLSYTLWGTMPDAELLRLASRGELHDRMDQQIDRMIGQGWQLRDGLGDFLGQWLQLRNLDNLEFELRAILRTRDRKEAYRKFNWRVRNALKQETPKLFEHLLVENRPVEEFLNADYTFLNKHSADFYGVGPLKGDHLRRHEWSDDSHRRGVLTHAAVLAVTSNPTRTSPVKRGLFVLENLLGVPAPPAPPDVPELTDSAEGELKDASLRTVLEKHRSDPACASCHSRMDPIGLAMENYNAIGLYRDEDYPPVERWWEVFKRKLEPSPIDSRGTLMTGESFDDVVGLADILATDRRDDFYRCLTEKWMTFALGRGPTYRDATAIDQVVRQTQAADGGMRTLLKNLLHSVPFTHLPAESPSIAARTSPRPVPPSP